MVDHPRPGARRPGGSDLGGAGHRAAEPAAWLGVLARPRGRRHSRAGGGLPAGDADLAVPGAPLGSRRTRGVHLVGVAVAGAADRPDVPDPDGGHHARAAAAALRIRHRHGYHGVRRRPADDRRLGPATGRGPGRAVDPGDASQSGGRHVNAQWNRLSPKSIVALTRPALAPYPVTILVMALAGARPAVLALTTLLWVLGALLLAAAVAVGWYFTKYRVTEERFELRQGILLRSHRSIPRDRIRSVDLTAAVHFRLFGLTVLRIGTGEQGSGATELRLTAVDRQHAEEMRTELLPR